MIQWLIQLPCSKVENVLTWFSMLFHHSHSNLATFSRWPRAQRPHPIPVAPDRTLEASDFAKMPSKERWWTKCPTLSRAARGCWATQGMVLIGHLNESHVLRRFLDPRHQKGRPRNEWPIIPSVGWYVIPFQPGDSLLQIRIHHPSNWR